MTDSLAKHHGKTYLVGGAVRDQLLSRKITERDYVVVGSTSEQMLACGFSQVGKDFPVFLHPKTKEEYALARTEKKQGQGYKGFICHASPEITLEEDLQRRDLTVNAMALDANGKIIDPFGGQKDLAAKILRHVSPAFSEDPLRVLRVARFASRYHHLGFTVAEETLQLMQEISESGELSTLSPERIWKEIERSLSEKNPEIFFEILHQCLALKEIWPDLATTWQIPTTLYPSGQHLGNVILKTLQAAVKLSDKTAIRFASMCLYFEQHPQEYTNKDGEAVDNSAANPKKIASSKPITTISSQLKLPNHVNSLAVKSALYHQQIVNIFSLDENQILTLFIQLDIWRKAEEFDDFLLTCLAKLEVINSTGSFDSQQINYVKNLAELVKTIDAQIFVKQGLKGAEIKTAMNQQRLKIIKQHLNS